MKISIKWILLLTLLLCANLSLNSDATSMVLALSAAAIVVLLLPLALCKWRILDEGGWWKFQGSKFGRVVVWCYTIAWLNIFLFIARNVVLRLIGTG